MSEFSNLLSLFIKTRDVNVSALTAYCELDRSTMYKLINGKRSPRLICSPKLDGKSITAGKMFWNSC